MPKNQKPTQARIKELLHYDAETGVFTRRVPLQRTQQAHKHGHIGAARIGTLGYPLVLIDGTNYIAGSVAWCYAHGEWPSRVKYINGNKTDLRLTNLRIDGGAEKDAPLTHDRLKELLHYEPLTGWFTWRVHSSTCRAGDRAGGAHGFGYRQVGLDYKKYLEHVLAWFYMTGEWPAHEIDHKNTKKADNRWSNLRPATRSQQGHNKPMGRRGKTGFPGVYPHGPLYRSRLDLDGNVHEFGCHKTIAEARIARLLGEKSIFGRFTTWVEERDGALPLGDTFVAVIVKGDRLYVLDANNVPIEVTDVKDISVVPINVEGHVLQ